MVAGLVLAACGQIAADGETVDGQRALAHAEAIVAYGPHPPGSNAQREVGLYLIGQLRELGLEVRTDAFPAMTPKGTLDMVNVWGVLPGEAEEVLILASHYDSKLFEGFRFVGANDPAASAGLVLELARVLKAHNPTPFTLWFVFFDGEEALETWTDQDSLYGSRRFVRRLQNQGEIGKLRAMLLLDLVGGKTLQLYRESNSTPWLSSILWSRAARMGLEDLFPTRGTRAVTDDHLPFLEAGVPAVDLVDLSYPYWHTAEDTVDKLSAENLGKVGEVVRTSLPEIARHLRQP